MPLSLCFATLCVPYRSRPVRPYCPPVSTAGAPSGQDAGARLQPTPLTSIVFRGRRVHIKRDDVLYLDGLAGSKARKFLALTQPGALASVSALVSFGGVQSNAMRSLALFAAHHEKEFIYYAPRPVPAHVWSQQSGNFYDAIAAGMELRDNLHPDDFDRYFRTPLGAERKESTRDWVASDIDHLPDSRILFVPQGGAWPGAEQGVSALADELLCQLDDLRASPGALKYPTKRPIVFLPAGTGTTAYYLANSLRGKCRVVVVPVSGDDVYLLQQMRSLEESHRRDSQPKLEFIDYPCVPEILRPRIRASFADIREGKLLIWREMERAANDQFHFDLVYAPVAWEEMWLAIEEGRIASDVDLVYLHTGGLEGNTSMLDRFAYKKLLSRNALRRQM
jgi:1-aminocyclopropane-1-carboxylate deaminase